jgi:putative SOS response-associated peptidase YedK
MVANADVARYRDRQMAVLRRRQQMDWLDLSRPEHELLQPLLIGRPESRARSHGGRGKYWRSSPDTLAC